jgi:hypothetical protein
MDMSRRFNSQTAAFSGAAETCPIHPHKEFSGTCLWIGDHQSRWTRPIADACQSAYAQIAIRCDTDAALERGCQAVTRIIVARIDSRPFDLSAIETLGHRHPSARKIEIRGPLCEAFYRFANPVYEDGIHPWNTSASILKLDACEQPSRSILVVAPDLDMAAPLLQLAETAGAVATWLRTPDPAMVRGIEEIWWHDAGFSADDLTKIATHIRSFGPQTRHLLISTGGLGFDSQQATHHGFAKVVALPGGIDALIGRSAPVAVSSLPIKMGPSPKADVNRRAA